MTDQDTELCRTILEQLMDGRSDFGVMGLTYGLCIAVEYQVQHKREAYWGDPPLWSDIHSFVRAYCKEAELYDEFTCP